METIILALFIFFFFLERIVSCGLNELNIRHLLSHKSRAPEFFRNSIDENTYSKSVAYTLDKGKMARWSLVYDTLVTIWILFGGVLPWLEEWS
ncbi:MAG: M48 family peptidase, partial [Nitrospinota bacterium]|nr:M48 family peptidase [Nitrospinota bacterium]